MQPLSSWLFLYKCILVIFSIQFYLYFLGLFYYFLFFLEDSVPSCISVFYVFLGLPSFLGHFHTSEMLAECGRNTLNDTKILWIRPFSSSCGRGQSIVGHVLTLCDNTSEGCKVKEMSHVLCSQSSISL